MPEVVTNFKGETRPWQCKAHNASCTRAKPCVSCRNRRNRRKGARGQGDARRVIERLTGLEAAFAGRKANEETWSHLPIRVEVKAGRSNGANSVFGHYFKAEKQAAAAKSVGDARPFVAAFKPDGLGDVIFVMRGSQLPAIVDALSGNTP